MNAEPLEIAAVLAAVAALRERPASDGRGGSSNGYERWRRQRLDALRSGACLAAVRGRIRG